MFALFEPGIVRLAKSVSNGDWQGIVYGRRAFIFRCYACLLEITITQEIMENAVFNNNYVDLGNLARSFRCHCDTPQEECPHEAPPSQKHQEIAAAAEVLRRAMERAR